MNKILNFIRYIIAIPCGVIGSLFVIILWNVIGKFPGREGPLDRVLWYHEIWVTIVYCVALYYIVHYIVPNYKRLIASISLILYSMLSIISVSFLTGAGIKPDNYTGGFTFQLILNIVILGVAIYSISKCNGQYKDGE